MPVLRPGLGDETGRWIRREHGYLEWRWAPGDLIELVNMEVSKEFRSQGIGRSMIAELESIPGAKGLYGFVSYDNTRMLSLYQHLGFTLLPVPNYYGWGRDGVLITKIVEAHNEKTP